MSSSPSNQAPMSGGRPSSAMPPTERIKRIADTASGIQMNPTVKATSYLRSGREMYRSAKNYMEDGSLENAYILYMRYLEIFVEKIRLHPGYKDIPVEDRHQINACCKEILPLAEEIKARLLEKYGVEHEEFLRREAVREREEKKRQEERAKQAALDQIVRESSGIKFPDNISPCLPTAATSPTPSSTGALGNHLQYPYSTFVPSEYDDLKPNASGSSLIPVPQFDRSQKPVRILSPVCTGLRQLIVPADIPSKFLALANSNTKRNCETCGILCGKIIREKLVITHMVIPKQSGSSDSCQMLNEEEIFFFQDSASLITFGWIHTHPSQTAFLSSVDLHTQYSYQLMMPEAIAIVCSPSHNQTGIFQINPMVGMEIIGKCTESTAFHPHTETSVPLFHEPSHCILDDARTVTVKDLR